jgi:hypothetical protein
LINLTAVSNLPNEIILVFFSQNVIQTVVSLIENIKSQAIIDSLFWLYSNLLGDIDNKAVRTTFVITPIFKKNIERCLDTSIKLADKPNSLNLIFNCVRNSGLDEWVKNQYIKIYIVF